MHEVLDLNEEYVRKKIRGWGLPDHLRPYRDAALALHEGDFRKMRRLSSDLMPGPNLDLLRHYAKELDSVSESERQRVVLEKFFGLK